MEQDWEARRREAMRPVEEAEELLIERAENFDEGRSPRRDAMDDAELSDPDIYGEADEEETSEDDPDAP